MLESTGAQDHSQFVPKLRYGPSLADSLFAIHFSLFGSDSNSLDKQNGINKGILLSSKTEMKRYRGSKKSKKATSSNCDSGKGRTTQMTEDLRSTELV